MKVQVNRLGLIVSVNALQPREDCETLDLELTDDVLSNLGDYLVRDGEVVLNGALEQEKLSYARQQLAKQYLEATDFYLVRQVETGADVPQEVLSKRATARALLVTQLPDFE
ncbi:TPA: hypothetical protein ACGUVV_004874 [Vibrio vulnificus]|uniref:hypothetical protein n=1 Tax=Vibrio vulnificus TaxID=672 RepID=UPI001A33AF90|nr:hypothetical protein [Vibrio vulnificus]HAS6153222.1 hypothetical protein [Vibrio vulnificus]HAS6353727.1 hypothetical protein [Vibrio vulnificus]HAS6367574.1 hypothetical protein [Vibrio vulnificus]HDY7611434.1 hypothetical protein [Vibrio vulnificus]